MPTQLTCPNGHVFWLPVELRDIGFSGNQVNFAVSCPTCGVEFDAAPEDGIYSTVAGEWRRVADYVADMSIEDLEKLRQQADRIRQEERPQEALELLKQLGWRPPSTLKSRLETANLAMDLLLKLSAIATMLLVAGHWTHEHVEQLFQQWFK